MGGISLRGYNGWSKLRKDAQPTANRVHTMIDTTALLSEGRATRRFSLNGHDMTYDIETVIV